MKNIMTTFMENKILNIVNELLQVLANNDYEFFINDSIKHNKNYHFLISIFKTGNPSIKKEYDVKELVTEMYFKNVTKKNEYEIRNIVFDYIVNDLNSNGKTKFENYYDDF
jgi:hypothetical protein